jgi:hypothetical protein
MGTIPYDDTGAAGMSMAAVLLAPQFSAVSPTLVGFLDH